VQKKEPVHAGSFDFFEGEKALDEIILAAYAPLHSHP
jgi:hypothetical protein